MSMQSHKRVVRRYFEALEVCSTQNLRTELTACLSADYRWRGMHPFDRLHGVSAFLRDYWLPLQRSFSALQRREQIFLAGENACAKNSAVWVCSMGHLMGLFDLPWLGIPPTHKLVFLPYAEFHLVDGDRISETVAFFDIPSVIRQSGHCVFPMQTGAAILSPGPRTQDGLLMRSQPVEEGAKTQEIVQQMIEDLANSDLHSSAAELGSSWHDTMCWFGPEGIGATYTLARYEQQHQGPFSDGLADIEFAGNDCLIAEGNYGGLFCWSGFRMRPSGGFMGLPASNTVAEMRVVDLYRRDGDKLVENWVFIDMLHFFYEQDLDILERLRQIVRS